MRCSRLSSRALRRDLGGDHRIAQQNGERFATHVMQRAEHGVAQAFHLFLPDKMNLGHLGDAANGFKLLSLVLVGQLVFQLKVAVEVLFDGPLALSDHHQNVRNARGHGLFDHVLNHGRIHDREHLLGLGFRGRKEASPESGGGYDGFAYRVFVVHGSSSMVLRIR